MEKHKVTKEIKCIQEEDKSGMQKRAIKIKVEFILIRSYLFRQERREKRKRNNKNVNH